MYCYPTAGHIITGNLKIIPVSRIRKLFLKEQNTDFLLILILINVEKKSLLPLMNSVIDGVSESMLSIKP